MRGQGTARGGTEGDACRGRGQYKFNSPCRGSRKGRSERGEKYRALGGVERGEQGGSGEGKDDT